MLMNAEMAHITVMRMQTAQTLQAASCACVVRAMQETESVVKVLRAVAIVCQ